MFGYKGAAEGLKSGPCLGQEYAKNPTLCRKTASISRPCLGRDNMHTLCLLHEFKPSVLSSVLSMRACYNTGKWKNILILMTL